MDFATVRKKLGKGSYSTLEQFEVCIYGSNRLWFMQLKFSWDMGFGIIPKCNSDFASLVLRWFLSSVILLFGFPLMCCFPLVLIDISIFNFKSCKF